MQAAAHLGSGLCLLLDSLCCASHNLCSLVCLRLGLLSHLSSNVLHLKQGRYVITGQVLKVMCYGTSYTIDADAKRWG